jgi:hypothetical protein
MSFGWASMPRATNLTLTCWIWFPIFLLGERWVSLNLMTGLDFGHGPAAHFRQK